MNIYTIYIKVIKLKRNISLCIKTIISCNIFRDNKTIYSGSQFGAYSRQNLVTKERKSVRPSRDLGETALRYNWQTPILLSVHNQDILYIGSQFLHRSFNQGDTWEAISTDLTQGGKEGNVAYGQKRKNICTRIQGN